MTRKDYRALAAGINSVRETLIIAHTDDLERNVALAAVDSVTSRIASVLADDNALFNRDTFFEAAGYGEK